MRCPQLDLHPLLLCRQARLTEETDTMISHEHRSKQLEVDGEYFTLV